MDWFVALIGWVVGYIVGHVICYFSLVRPMMALKDKRIKELEDHVHDLIHRR